MRKQTRPQVPEQFAMNWEVWTSQWTDLRAKNPAATFRWYVSEGVSAREYILPVLRDMNQSHCSFCDFYPLEPSSNEPIEHFRPKSRSEFATLAFAWTNLYYSCEVCQSHKGEKWSNLLLCPDDENYEFSHYFMFDFTTGGMEPNPKASDEVRERAKTTIDMYGLDSPTRRKYRKIERRKWQKSTERTIDEFAYRDFIEAPDESSFAE